MNPLDRAVGLLEQLVAQQRAAHELLVKLQADVGRAVRVHLEDRVGARSWPLNGSATLAPTASATVVTFTPPQNYAWRLKQLGMCADRWDDPSGVRGISYTLRRGGAAAPFFDNVSFPWGSIADRGEIYLVGNGSEPFSLVATNNDAVDTLSITVAAVGVCYSVEYGGA